jgi:phosphorylase kinase alpha/beta subunit
VEGVEVHPDLIVKGETTLAAMLPRESKRKFVDLALLSLIYPYGVVTQPQAEDILAHVEYHLLRKRGVIRYKGDRYYNKNEDGWSEEAEWTFGLSWLAIIYARMGKDDKAHYFLEEAKKTVTSNGAIPELYFSNSKKHNENTPLGWSESLFLVALHDVNKKRL